MNDVKGFTLIELLIVLVLIGVITGVAMLSMGTSDPRDQQKFEADRLVKLLNLATQESMARGDVMGIEFFENGYRFAVVKKQKWQPEVSDMVFKERELLPQMRLAFSMNQQNMMINKRVTLGLEPKPQIIITPDGEMDLFQISLRLQNSNSIFFLTNTSQDGLSITSQDTP